MDGRMTDDKLASIVAKALKDAGLSRPVFVRIVQRYDIDKDEATALIEVIVTLPQSSGTE